MFNALLERTEERLALLARPRSVDGFPIHRRRFLHATSLAAVSIVLPGAARGSMRRLARPVRLGLIADLHHDVMHDAAARLDAFLESMAADPPDAIIQLGDFAWPAPKNRPVVDAFSQGHSLPLHVIGNHDTDGGYTFEQLLDAWSMNRRYYARDVGGLRLIVLDANERPPNHGGGYPAHVGPEQIEWLRGELKSGDGPIVVCSHQPLAGSSSIDNAPELQRVLNAAADRVVLAVNGHTHIDDLVRADNIVHLHVNSASYQWVGGAHKHQSYSATIHAAYPYISHTCPYRDALFTVLTLDPKTGEVHLRGSQTDWVGKSPAELGVDLHPDLIDGEQIVPKIRERRIPRPANR